MSHLVRSPLADQVAEVLLGRIAAGEWPLGSKIPGETTLAAQIGVGRSTIREAVRLLAGRGVVEPRHGSGVFVTAVEPVAEWGAAVGRADIAAVIEARIAVESEAAALAADRRTAGELRGLRRELRSREAAKVGGIAELVDADMAFHRAVVAASHNPVLADLFDWFVPRVRSAMLDLLHVARATDDGSDHVGHVGLVEAIAQRDSEAAARMSRIHLQTLKEVLG